MKITDATPISIGLSIIMIGGAGWVTQIYTTGQTNATDVREIRGILERKREIDQEFREKVLEDLSKIKERLSVK